MNKDVAWLLYAAQRLLEGAKLNIDIYEINPPISVYFNLPPALLSKYLSLPAIPVFYAYMMLVICISLLLCWHLTKLLYKDYLTSRYYILVSMAFITTIWVNAHLQFGQREHITVVLLMPYLLAAIVRLQRENLTLPIALAVGLLAGAGLSFKPFFLGVWILVEIYLVFSLKNLSPLWRNENLIITIFLVLFMLALFIFQSNYLKIGLLLGKYYLPYNNGYSSVIFSKEVILWLLTGVVICLFIKLNHNDKKAIILLYIASTGFLLSALVQQKGWPNHLYPLSASCLFILLLITYQLSVKYRISKKYILVGLYVIFSGLFAAGMLKMRPDTLWYANITPLPQLIPLVKDYARTEPVYALTTELTPPFPMINYTGASWPYHFASLWPLPGFYCNTSDGDRKISYHHPDSMSAAERFFLDTVITDLQTYPPKLLLVDQSEYKMGFGRLNFNFLDYFSNDPRFLTFLKGYEYLKKVGTYEIYQKR
ncbi:MAG: hypothetical protein ACHQ2F_06430 [Desulfobaccales bacterium]